MAYDVYQRPAMWVSTQTSKHRNRLIVLVAALFVGSCIGVALQVSHHPSLASTAAAMSIVISLALVAPLDRMTENVIHWMRGDRAERSIGYLLNELRGESYIVMHDIKQVGEGNVDHLVSGPTGVFMIESKARRYPDEALRKARRQAAKLHDELDNWVVPVICIHERDREPFRHEKVWIVPEQHLLDWIRAQHEDPVPFKRLARFADTMQSD